MGFAEYQISQSIDNPTYAFDTKYAYQYTAGGWNRLGGIDWSGDDLSFFGVLIGRATILTIRYCLLQTITLLMVLHGMTK
jgi:hypothetical protein